MKILFSMDEQVHQFKITGEVNPSDIVLLKQSLFQFFETQPAYVVLDLSEIHLQVPDFELQNTITEITTLAKSKKMNLAIAQTDIEARRVHQRLMESALVEQIELLKSKIELREEILKNIEELRAQNQSIRRSLEEKNKVTDEKSGFLSPLIERLWSDR
jgi:hypothetical protein